jgi:hypothetical protein
VICHKRVTVDVPGLGDVGILCATGYEGHPGDHRFTVSRALFGAELPKRVRTITLAFRRPPWGPGVTADELLALARQQR